MIQYVYDYVYKSEKIDAARHLLQLPPEPTLVVENVPKRTAVSEIPPVEMELLDTFVKECIQAYTMPNSFIHNSSSVHYSGDYRKLPLNEILPDSLPPLQYEPIEQKIEEIYNATDKKDHIHYSHDRSLKHGKLKKGFMVLKKMEDEDKETGIATFHLEVFKDEKESVKRSHPKFNVFLCDAILEAQIIPDDPNQSKKGQKYLFELLQQSHDGVISPHGVVFGSDTPEQRNHWVDSINDALAIQRKSEFQEGSEPEDDLDEEKLNSRISAQQNSVIFRQGLRPLCSLIGWRHKSSDWPSLLNPF